MSSEMPWVKLYTEMLDDPKIGPLDERRKWRFTEACLLAGECDSNGYLTSGDKPLTLQDIAWRVRSTVEQIQPDYEALIQIGVIVFDPECQCYFIPNFSRRQGRPQHEKRDQWRQWQDKHREKAVRPDKNDVMPDTGMSQAPRGEERRERGEKEGEEREPPPATFNFSESQEGAIVYAMLKTEYPHTTDRFENATQRSAYLEVFGNVNGELEALVKKALSKGIRTKGDLLVWLQGCAKRASQPSKKTEKPKKVYR